MEINLNGKHLGAMAICFLLGGAVGYLAKPDNKCPQLQEIRSTFRQPKTNQETQATNNTRNNSNTPLYAPASRKQQTKQRELEKGFNKIARELNLSQQQQEDVLSIIDKNYPNREFLSGTIEPAKVLQTIEELKPVLTGQQKKKLEDMVMKELMKNGIRF